MTLESARDTLQSRGYHMTEQNKQDLEDAALGRYTRRKQDLEAAETLLRQAGVQMSRFASELSRRSAEDLIGFKFESYSWLNPQAIKDLAQDVVRAREEVGKARDQAVHLGVAVD